MTTILSPEFQEARELLERATKLPPELRERIALELIHSIEPPPNADTDWVYWKAEIARRIEAVRNGTMKTYTLEEASAYWRHVANEGDPA